MKLGRLVAVLGSLALYASAVLAGSEGAIGQKVNGIPVTPAVGGISLADTSHYPLQTSASGLKMWDGNPDRDLVYTWSDIIPTDSLKVAGDSSTVIQLQGARHLILALKGCPKGTTTSVSKVAIQVRTHINSQTDSSSTIPIYMTASTASSIATAVPGQDSIAVGQARSGSATAPWPDEFVVYMDLAKCGPNGSAVGTFSYPGGIGIPLDNFFGRDLRLSNISIRARIIGGPSVVDFTATLLGFGK